MVEVSKLFLDGTVEPLYVSVHFRCSWIRVVVGYLKVEETFSEVFLELTSIVSENKGGGIGKYLLPHEEELLCSFRSMRGGDERKGKARVYVFTGNEVST